MLEADLNYGLICLSRGGLGKTTMVLRALEHKGYKKDEHYLYSNNYSTPLKFYNLLQRTNELVEPRFLVLDDIELAMKNPLIVSMLRSALWEAGKRRTVNYLSSSPMVTEEEVEFTGKIIILLNDLPADNRVLNALKDRVFFHEIELTPRETLDVMREYIVKQPYKKMTYRQRVDVLNAIEARVSGKQVISFRTLIKAYQCYIFSPSNWLTMLDSMIGEKLSTISSRI